MLDDFHDRVAKGLSGDVIAARLQTDSAEQTSRTASSTSSALRPSTDWGPRAASRSSSKTAATPASKALQDDGRRRRRRRPQTPGLKDVFTSFRANTPWLYLDIDRTAAKTMGVSMGEMFNTLQVYLGSLYVNDFNRFGRTWQVNVQAAPNFRSQIDDIKQIKIRNDQGNMVPLATLAGIREINGPVLIMRYNMYPAAADQRDAGRGRQLGTGDRTMPRRPHGPPCPGRCRPNGPSWPCCSCKRATRPCSSFCWPSCSCSWCWPPSTKAGRCRWP